MIAPRILGEAGGSVGYLLVPLPPYSLQNSLLPRLFKILGLRLPKRFPVGSLFLYYCRLGRLLDYVHLVARRDAWGIGLVFLKEWRNQFLKVKKIFFPWFS